MKLKFLDNEPGIPQPAVNPPEAFAAYACRCGDLRQPRYHTNDDDVYCTRCKRWVAGFLPDPNPARRLMPVLKAGRVDHPARKRRRARVAQAVRGGMPGKDAAALFGITTRHVVACCLDNDVTPPFRPDGSKSGGTLKVLKELMRDGSTPLGVSKSMGLTRARTWQVYNEAVELGLIPAKEKPTTDETGRP